VSFRVDVLASGETRWASNARRFETEDEGREYARDLWRRWLAVKAARVVPADTPKREVYEPGSENVDF
jgi:hypothetical protein